jgi:hypothetical protein
MFQFFKTAIAGWAEILGLAKPEAVEAVEDRDVIVLIIDVKTGECYLIR